MAILMTTDIDTALDKPVVIHFKEDSMLGLRRGVLTEESKTQLKQLIAEAVVAELEQARAQTKPHMALYLSQPYKQEAVPDEYLIRRIKRLNKGNL